MAVIYCIEDDQSIRDLILYALENNGYEAKGFESGELLKNNTEPDLILLDIMLPGDDGYTILKSLKTSEKTRDIPVIMLTSKTSEYDKVKGLDMGADDYIEKPFGVMELISRIKAVLRRSKRLEESLEVLCLEDLCIDNRKHQVTVNGDEVTLTYKEYELLHFLMKNKGLVVSRDKLINEVWGYDFEGESRTVDVHVRTLRLKLGDAGKLIQTIRSVGYKIG
ncbi:response regulator transcription factor [Tissierella creatinini]|nr:response regulator transcription factor [Tissierella creatinini]TJX62255.1 response regulator transcription factor [Soehngenia saccharolytica]